MAVRLPLPSAMTTRGAPALRNALLTLRGEALELDGSSVAQLSAPALQVLLSARRTWSEDGVDFALVAPSEALQAKLNLFGAHALLAA